MEDNKLITLAIHRNEKAYVLKRILEDQGIKVTLEEVRDEHLGLVTGIAVRIQASDLSKSLVLAEANRLFRYDDADTYKIDDGRKRILVSVDFSDYSMKACQMAFGIAKVIGAKVKILHVYHNFYYPSSLPFADTLKESPDEGMLRNARKQMLDLCIEIEKNIVEGILPSINYSYSLREGIVEEEIDLFVKEYKPVLLVAGTKGKGNNKNMLGRVTADIIEMTDVPVLAVPQNSPINKMDDVKHVAFLTNLQKRDMASFDNLVKFLEPYPYVKITLLHINRSNKRDEQLPEEQLVKMKAHFEKQYPQFNIGYQLIENPDLPQAINDYAVKEEITLICLNTRRRNIFGRMFSPSVSRKVLFNSNVALLVLRG